MRPVSQPTIENLALDQISRILLEEKHLRKLVTLTNQELEDSLDGMNQRISNLDSQIIDTERRLAHLLMKLSKLACLLWTTWLPELRT